MSTLVIDYLGREKRYALLKNNRLEKLRISQPSQESLVGNIYLGIVTKVLPGMNAAFVDIGLEQNGYLHASKLPGAFQNNHGKKAVISSLVHQGERVLVQIEKDATGNKGPRLTGKIEFPGNMLVYLPKGDYIAVSKKLTDPETRKKWRSFGETHKMGEEGFLFRTACEQFSETEVAAELERLRSQYEKTILASGARKKPGLITERNIFLEELHEEIVKMNEGLIVCNDGDLAERLMKMINNDRIEVVYDRRRENIFFAYDVDQKLQKTLKKVVWLENSAYLVFDETEALTVIDVNTGKFSGKMDQRETIVKTNELAAEEIARQIKLRDLSGIILIDFIGMKEKSDEEHILKKMTQALAGDDKRTTIAGFTSLGIFQLTRKRTNVSLLENLTTPCSVCHGTGRVLSAETVAFQLERELWEYKGDEAEAVLIECTEDVKDVFCGENNSHLLRLEEVFGFKIFFAPVPKMYPFYHIRRFGELREITRLTEGEQ